MVINNFFLIIFKFSGDFFFLFILFVDFKVSIYFGNKKNRVWKFCIWWDGKDVWIVILVFIVINRRSS